MTVLAHIGKGTYDPLIVMPLVALAFAYLMRVRQLGLQGRPVAFVRRLFFAGGIAVLIAALVSPVSHVGGELLWMHMLQHLLMMDIGSLLIVLGVTGPLLQPLLRNRVLGRLRYLANPVLILPLWALNLYLWHLPVLYQATLVSQPTHALEHVIFISLGVGLWMPLFGPLPTPAWFGNGAKLLYIVVVRAAGALLANIFIWSGAVFYPHYARGEKLWSVSALADQGAAGQIMMIEGSILTLFLFGWLFFKAARESEQSQALIDYAQAEGVKLDRVRAARAAEAGRSEQLRERIAVARRLDSL